MTNFRHKTFSFNAGEISPRLLGRSDFEKYHKGCKSINNMIVLPHGGAMRRTGTEFVAMAKYNDRNTKLFRFEFAVNEAYILEFGHEYIRFFTSGGGVLKEEGEDEPYEISSPYNEDEIAEIRTVQSHDVVYLVHKDYPPMTLSRYGHTDWRLEQFDYKNGPFLTENLDDDHELKLTETIEAWSDSTEYDKDDLVAHSEKVWRSLQDENLDKEPPDTDWWEETDIDPNRIIIDASVDKITFNSQHVGSLWNVRVPRDDTIEKGSIGAQDAVSNNLWVEEGWKLTTHGDWAGTITLEVSQDGGDTWLPDKTYSSETDNNVADAGLEDTDGAYYRLKFSNYNSGTVKYTLSASDYYHNSVVQVTNYVHETRVVGSLKSPKARYDEWTSVWAEGSWSYYRGWPRAICFFEQRLVLANTVHQPQTIWASRTGDYNNFKSGVKDDDGLTFTLASNDRNPIYWLQSQEVVIVGTLGGVWRFGATDQRDPLTPSNVQARKQSVAGTVKAVASGDIVLFISRNSDKVYELVYDPERMAWQSPDMSILAEHLTEEHGITEIQWHEVPIRALWAIRSDGTLLSFTYQRDHEVTAWAKHDTLNGKFLDVNVIPGVCGDEAWVIVDRVITGQTRKMIEFLRFPVLPADFAVNTLGDWGELSWAYTQCAFSPCWQYDECEYEVETPVEVQAYDSCIWSI